MRNTFPSIAARIIGFAVALLATHGAVQAETISNTANITWRVGTSVVGKTSNRVDILVNRPSVEPGKPVLSTHQLVGSAGNGTPINIPTTMCQGNNGLRPISLEGVFAGTSLSPAQTKPSNSIRAGEPLIVAVDSAADNKDSARVETLTIKLETPSGDEETITLSETSANSARFVGIIRTAATPPAPVRGDCVLSVHPGDTLNLSGLRASDNSLIASSPVNVLIDPFGIVFDSGDGTPVPGSRVTLIDAATGQPATVFGDDGVSIYPSSVITGATVTDSGGNVYNFPAGDYRFPFARAGQYRLLVEPPAPFIAPSNAQPADLSHLRRPDGPPFTIVDGSYSRVFTLNDPSPVRIDIPVDRPGGALILTKAASQSTVTLGDAVQYRISVSNTDSVRSTGAVTVTDVLPIEMRLRKDTVRYNGNLIAYQISPDGRTLTIPLAALRPAERGQITYLLEVRPDARAGMSLNRATASDNRGLVSNTSDASVRITRDGISERITIIGRITEGGCTLDPNTAKGIANVRVMLEDGTYTITDEAGRYHFEGILPGLHVVQMDPSSLPADQVPVDCNRNARTSGSAISRFVEGRGGALLRADFRANAGTNAYRLTSQQNIRAKAPSDSQAAGSEFDYFADQTAEVKWLFPATDYNPRTKAVRIAIKHLGNQSVNLFANGKPVPAVTFEGSRKNGDGAIAVSLWRGLELPTQNTLFRAEILDEAGKIVQTLERNVHFAGSPIRAELLKDKSVLLADGVTRPVIAFRLFDREGLPVSHGLVGDFAVPAPYYPAVEADAQNARTLSGLERARPVWHVEGDQGIAYIELEPTTASGGVTITLPLRDGDVTREQQLDLWLTPGDRPWTIVGFAAGTIGYNTLENNAEEISDSTKDPLTDGRIALYAKGRVKGSWLMTMSYDSDKRESDTRFAGIIDPTAYYTIYADRAEQRYDAASVRKLYLRLERPQFYALFGDYETGLHETELARYSRSFNGVKSEFRNDQVSVTAFAADTPFRHRREEIQGNGLSGPYQLTVRDILANSERITIETRDRLRSERIIETRTLTRHIDYDIDYGAGTLRFREPVLSRSSGLDPQFIVADYEVDGVAQRVVNAGGRVTVQNKAKTLKIGGSLVHDETEQANTNLGAIDARYRPNANTEVRAEFALSDAKAKAGNTSGANGSATAWLVEAEHHGAKVDLLAYVREHQSGYGVGQVNSSENGTRKFGVDGRLRLSEAVSLTGSAYQEDYLNSAAKRQAGKLLAEYRTKGADLRAGLTLANERLEDGRTAQSQIAQLGATKRLFDNRLELDAQTEFALSSSESIDFPSRHRFGARYRFTDDLSVIGSYELASGESVDARTARIGFDLKPWRGGTIIASANQQNIGEYGPRSFAAYGVSQSVPVGKKVTLDFTLDGNKTLGGIDPSRVLNDAQPVASGGFIGTDGTLTEDFTSVTAGATYRGERWSIVGRAEYRDGTTTNRHGLTLAGLRQIGEGQAFGGQLSLFKAKQLGGATTQNAALALSWAHRPDTSRFAFLEKLELRMDKVSGAIAGQSGPIGGAPLLISGDAVSKRIINSLSVNWSPRDRTDEGEYLTRSEVSFFWGSRYVFDRYGQDDLKGWSNLVGSDIRFDLGKHVDIGASGTVRVNPGARSTAFAGGPVIGISPAKNTYVTVGYNVIGFRDRDFQQSRYTQSGPFVTLKLKFDQENLGFLGLGRKEAPRKVEKVTLPQIPVQSEVVEAPQALASVAPVPEPQIASVEPAIEKAEARATRTATNCRTPGHKHHRHARKLAHKRATPATRNAARMTTVPVNRAKVAAVSHSERLRRLARRKPGC